jgi:hypothetical protein
MSRTSARQLFIPAAAALAALLTPSSSLAAPLPSDVLRVGPTQAFTTISAAVAEAASGDVLLVDAGDYAEDLIVGIGVAIVADGGPAALLGRLQVVGIPESEQLLIAGLNVTPPQGAAVCEPEPAAQVAASRGTVHFQDCSIVGPLGFGGCPGGVGTEGNGGHALRVELAFNVVLQDCVLQGGRGGTASAGLFSPPGGRGGTGLDLAASSSVTLSSSSANGGVGGFSTSGGLGGRGVDIGPDSTLFAHGSIIAGGDGGDTFDLFEGTGGDGLFSASTSSSSRLQDTPVSGGAAGRNGFIPGEPGEAFSGVLSSTFLSGTPCRVSTPSLVQDGEPWQIQFDNVGVDGEGSFLFGQRPAFRFSPVFERPLHVRWPAPDAVRFDPIAAGSSGQILLPFGPSPPPVGSDALIVWTQMICTDVNGVPRLSESRAIVLIGPGI